ncbi:glutamate-cysteine ligase family protein [Streptomyces sp. NPDC098781]|uniref:glutamate-cysteine ligase family protein n=1 Tax=Streptomyces sp. NPDC098781 TaxID=3366097 RepID=UPI0037F24996
MNAALARVDVAGTFPGGSRITLEPGGQLELSSRSAVSLAGCVEAMATDLTVLREAVESAGLILVGTGLDPYREPPRILDHSRYRAMEKFFDREGPAGPVMMRSTASVQINPNDGDESHSYSGFRYRWELAHRVGPVLVAAFANSPILDGWHPSAGRPACSGLLRAPDQGGQDPARNRRMPRTLRGPRGLSPGQTATASTRSQGLS